MAKKSPSFSGNPALVGLGAAVRAARQAQGLSQEALAELAGIDRSYMGGIERGEHNLAKPNCSAVTVETFKYTAIYSVSQTRNMNSNLGYENT